MDKTFRISNNLRDFNLVFSLEVDLKNSDDYSFYIDIEQLSEGRKVIIPHIIRKDGSAFNLKNFSLRITIPLLDIHGISMPGKYDNPYLSRIPWNFNEKTSSHQNFPFLSFINREGMNKLALGVKNPALGYHVIGKLDEGNECEIKLEIKTIGNILGKSFQPQIFFFGKERPGLRLQRYIVSGQKLRENIFLHMLMNLFFVHGMQYIRNCIRIGLRKQPLKLIN